jgi:hypothetical protein
MVVPVRRKNRRHHPNEWELRFQERERKTRDRPAVFKQQENCLPDIVTSVATLGMEKVMKVKWKSEKIKRITSQTKQLSARCHRCSPGEPL